MGCQTCRDICEERKQCLSFHVRSSSFLPSSSSSSSSSLSAADAVTGGTLSTLALTSMTIPFSHTTRWLLMQTKHWIALDNAEIRKEDNRIRPYHSYHNQCIEGKYVKIFEILFDRIFKSQLNSNQFVTTSASRATVWRSQRWNATGLVTQLASLSTELTIFYWRWDMGYTRKHTKTSPISEWRTLSCPNYKNENS